MPGYTRTTWVNGTTAVNASNMNNIESFLASLSDTNISFSGSGLLSALAFAPNLTPVSVTGTTAGSASLYQFLQGTIKAAWLFYNGYRNSTATEQKLALPVPFTGRSGWIAFGGNPVTHFFASGSQLTSQCNVVTALPTGSGAGSVSTQSAINGYSFGEIEAAYDNIGLGVSQSQTFTACVLFVGI